MTQKHTHTHTQGPLGPYGLAEKGCEGSRMIALGDSDAYAKVFNDPHDDHARLIAAAPELLEAVAMFLKCHDADRDYSDMNWDFARAALAKAGVTK